MHNYQRQIMVSGHGTTYLPTLTVSRLRSVWRASIAPWSNPEQCVSFTDEEEEKIPELTTRHVLLNNHDFLKRVQLVARVTQGIDFRYVDSLTSGPSLVHSPSHGQKRAKECEGNAVARFRDGRVMHIDPFCTTVADVQTSDNRWLCLDCAAYHFRGWSEPDTEQRVVRHRRDIGFDREEESTAQAIAYLNR